MFLKEGLAWMTWSHFRGWREGGGVENNKQFLSCQLTSQALSFKFVSTLKPSATLRYFLRGDQYIWQRVSRPPLFPLPLPADTFVVFSDTSNGGLRIGNSGVSG